MPARAQFEVYEDPPLPQSEFRAIRRIVQQKRGQNGDFLPVPIKPIPPKVEQLLRNPLPSFEPRFRVEYKPWQANYCGAPLQLFLRLFDERCLNQIVEKTNARAESLQPTKRQKAERYWHPLTRNELLRWIGILLFIGRHNEPKREYNWRCPGHDLGRFMGRQRWEQIFRYLTINPRELQPRDPWWAKVEPVSMWIRENCLFAVLDITDVSRLETFL